MEWQWRWGRRYMRAVSMRTRQGALKAALAKSLHAEAVAILVQFPEGIAHPDALYALCNVDCPCCPPLLLIVVRQQAAAPSITLTSHSPPRLVQHTVRVQKD